MSTQTLPNSLTEEEVRDGWELLFDGQTLNGWMCPYDDYGWTVADGTIALERPMGQRRNLYTKDRYGDFLLELDYKTATPGNSGVFLRTDQVEDPVHTGLEIQILDVARWKGDLHTHANGAIYDLVAPRSHPARPDGEWNTFVIRCEGPHISVSLNGEDLAEMDVSQWTEAGKNPDGKPNKFKYAWAELPRHGHIGLQDHGLGVWFRNVKLRRR